MTKLDIGIVGLSVMGRSLALNKKECSWFDFAKKIVEFSHLNCLVEPCTSEQFPRPAKRPAYSSLDKSELDQAVGNQMRDWEVALKCYIMNLDKGEK